MGTTIWCDRRKAFIHILLCGFFSVDILVGSFSHQDYFSHDHYDRTYGNIVVGKVRTFNNSAITHRLNVSYSPIRIYFDDHYGQNVSHVWYLSRRKNQFYFEVKNANKIIILLVTYLVSIPCRITLRLCATSRLLIYHALLPINASMPLNFYVPFLGTGIPIFGMVP